MEQRQWHVIDAAGTQQGPMPAADLAALWRAGRVDGSSLVWREGLSTWRPLRELAAELGLDPVGFASAAMPPPPPTASAGEAANPYAPMPHAAEARAWAPSNDIVYAGFLRRWAALVIDQIVLALPFVLLILGIGGAAALSGDPERIGAGGGVAFVMIYLGWLVAWPLYFILQESSAAQATLGKRAMGIKVTDDRGERIRIGHAFGRWVAAALSYITFYVGFLMAAFTQRKQALHDIVAGTLVVDRWAYTDHPERQKRGVSGCLVVFLIAMLMVPVLAILAAISISQYQDYVVRSQVSEGMSMADGVKTAVDEYARDHEGRWPANNEEAGLDAPADMAGEYVSAIDVGAQPGRIVVSYSSQPPQKAHASIDGRHLVFVAEPDGDSLRWTCESEDLPQKSCPTSCQCTGSR